MSAVAPPPPRNKMDAVRRRLAEQAEQINDLREATRQANVLSLPRWRRFVQARSRLAIAILIGLLVLGIAVKLYFDYRYYTGGALPRVATESAVTPPSAREAR